MRYLKRTIVCILFAVVSLMNSNVYAVDANSNNTPMIVFEAGSSFQIDAVNKASQEGQLTIYTSSYGEYSGAFQNNTREFIVVNNIVVQENTNRTTGTYIPPNGFVVSYTGDNKELLTLLTAGGGLSVVGVEIPALPDMYFKLKSGLVPIDQVNSIREANQITLYDTFYGATTRTNAWGIELTIVNNTVRNIIDMKKENGVIIDNNSPIPEDGVVISIHSGSPYYKQLHESVKPGDKIIVEAASKLYNANKIKFSAYNPKTVSDNPAGWDKAKGKPYDGYRGSNQLIIYDSSYGSSTGTNPYGFEVTVNSHGNIISAGGNNSNIPKGGYVLSGHGDKVKWLQKYASLGASVKLNTDKKDLLIILTPSSQINLAARSIESASEALELARAQYLDIPYERVQGIISSAQSKLQDMQANAASGSYDTLVNTAKEIQKASDNAYYMTFESVKVENRAVWLRPKDTSIVQIQKRLDALKELNINTIFLETYWNGYAIYPTGSAIMKQNPMFKDMDILGIYLKEAHARGLEVHAWVENFLVDQPVAVKKPEWMAISRKGDSFYLENGVTKYYFLNPALPEVRDFLSELYKELIKKYNLDGIQFDYMRYSHSGDYSNDFGYDKYTRTLFKGYAGIDPISLKPGDVFWKEWCSFRAYTISSYAYRVMSELKSLKPGLKLSTDVWPEYDKTLVDIYQDPKSWTRNDFLNSLIPMSYYLDEVSVKNDIDNSWIFARGHSQLTSGIATFNKVDTKVLLRQINAIRSSNTSGISIFEYESLFSGKYADALRLGAFSKPAMVTNRDPEQSIKTIINEILIKIDGIYLKNKGIDNYQAEKYKELISKIEVMLNTAADKTKAAYQLKNDLETITKTINSDSTLNEKVAERLSWDFYNAINIINAYISDLRLLNTHEVRKFQVELPMGALEKNKKVDIKVKAVFDDNTSIYLDKTQYSLRTDDPSSVIITGESLSLNDIKEKASITVDIMESFRFHASRLTDRRIEFILTKDGKVEESSVQNLLKASEISYTGVKLDWGNIVLDSNIAGYVIYRDSKEIARISSDVYRDRTLLPGKQYNYYIQGFDAAGNIICTSNLITVTTKAHVLTYGP